MPADPDIPRFPFPPSPAPYDFGPEMRETMAKCPVNKVKLPDDSTAWLVTGYSETREVFVDSRYSRALVFAPGRPLYGVEATLPGSMTAMDPPEHSRFRKLVATAFTDKRIQALRPAVARIVDDLIDKMIAGPRPADLSHEFSLMLPASVICLMLGVPISDVDKFHAWSNAMFGDWSRSQEEIGQAFAEMGGYMAGLIAAKRAEPADDLITLLINARDADAKLSETELIQVPLQLLAAGHETTANSINMSFVALCQYPDELARLRANPDLIPTAVEELLRFVNIAGSSFVPLSRVTREDVCLGGVEIPAGETTLPAFFVANRDPAVFADPDRLSLDNPPKTHLAFGAGAHYCLGAQLARMELQEAFRGLLTRLPNLRMTIPVSELEFRDGQAIASMRELPVTWDDV